MFDDELHGFKGLRLFDGKIATSSIFAQNMSFYLMKKVAKLDKVGKE